MVKLPNSFMMRRKPVIMLCGIGTLLAACSPQPLRPCPPPQVIQAPRPLISPELLILPSHREIDRLLESLQLPPLKLDSASSNITHSLPSSSPN